MLTSRANNITVPDIRINKAIRTMLAVMLLLFCISWQVGAQTPADDPLVTRFDDYMQARLQEKIYLHSDKNFYLAGEICWFKLYGVDASYHKPLDMSKLAYVELLNEKNKPVLQAKIALAEGFGNGSFLLPSDLESGKYRLRSYTSWMKNYSVNYFFEKELTVINPRHFTGKDSSAKKITYTLALFPEGGNLVNGIQSKVAFSVTDQYGRGVSGTGVVINDSKDTLLNIKTKKFGMGSFVLTPENGRTYEAVIVLSGGEKITQKLPAAFPMGYVMQLEEADSNTLRITVHSAGEGNGTVYLFAHTRGLVKILLNSRAQNGVAVFTIDKSKLGDGISQFTVFNAERIPVCERLYFKYPENKLDIHVRTDNPQYGDREKIIVHVRSADQSGNPLPAFGSVAVYQTDSLHGIDDMNIDNWLWLSSDLEGRVESPGYYFVNKTAETAEAMDNLMLTKGWRRFRWEDVQQNKKASFEFVPEYTGHIIRGKVTDSATGYPARGIAVYLSSPGTHLNFRTDVSDSNGMIRFVMKDFYSNGELILHSRNPKDSLLNIEVQDPFSHVYSNIPMSPFSQTTISASGLMNHHVALQVQNQYFENRQNKFGVPDYDSLPFFGKPDYSYLLDDYTRFTTMEEVLREYVYPVTLTSSRGKFDVRVLNTNKEHVFFDSPPLVLLNGVPVLDFNRVMRYDPFDVKKLEIITRPWYYGDMAFPGIMNFVGYDSRLQGFELDPHSTVIDYDGLQSQREFYSPVYDTKPKFESRLPDFRKLLYWSPNVQTNAKGEQEISFYSSDLPGTFTIVVQGISKDGKTGTAISEFSVREESRK